MNKYQSLKSLINAEETLVVPDAYDAVSARLIEYAGFPVVQCSGYSYSISMNYPNEKYVTLDENVLFTKRVVDAVNIPVMADGEDGYGVGEVFKKNVLKYINTGIAGINIEDQNLWNSYDTNAVVDEDVMIDKIKIVNEIKNNLNIPDFILNARTDAMRISDNRKECLKEAIYRANLYIENGADMCFVTNIITKEEIKTLKKEIAGHFSIAAGLPNNVNNFSVRDCIELGVDRVSLPSMLIFSTVKTMFEVLNDIKETKVFTDDVKDKLVDYKLLNDILNNK